jgi:hypothetical protein
MCPAPAASRPAPSDAQAPIMLPSLEIKNFRMLEDFRVEKLGLDVGGQSFTGLTDWLRFVYR